jgi:uncharacterized membrane protein
MNWNPFKPKPYFSEAETQLIVQAIQHAETQTSGEIRLFIESKCKGGNPLERAKEVFADLSMHQTQQRNAVLIYIASKDHKMAIYGDEGIHSAVGQQYWEAEYTLMKTHFSQKEYAIGLQQSILHIGEKLKAHFPYQSNDKNELPNEIVFGK